MKVRSLFAVAIFAFTVSSSAQTTSTFNITSYGATANDSTDDTNAIQSAVNAAALAGGGDVFIPAGVYLLNAQTGGVGIVITSKPNVRLRGVGNASELKSTISGLVMIRVTQSDGFEARDLTLNGNAAALSSSGGAGIHIIGSSRCTIDGVYVKNLGGVTAHGGSHVTIEGWESNVAGNPVPSAPVLLSTNNRVTNSVFDDADGYAGYGISLATSWAGTPGPRAGKVSNSVVEGNRFIGFTWNAIEIAGPGTVGNSITANVVESFKGESAIEADKGASYNTFSGNTIRNYAGTTAGPALMRAQKGNGAGGTYHYATGNVFTGNTSSGLGSQHYGHGFAFDGARDTVVSGNVFDVTSTDSSSEIYGISIGDRCSRLQISDNVIVGAAFGIANTVTSPEAAESDYLIANNIIDARLNGIRFDSSSSAMPIEKLSILGNTVRGTLTSFGILLGLNVNASTVSQNHVFAPANAIRVAGTADSILDNTILSATSTGISIDGAATNSFVMGNVVTVQSGGTIFSTGGTNTTAKFNSWQ